MVIQVQQILAGNQSSKVLEMLDASLFNVRRDPVHRFLRMLDVLQLTALTTSTVHGNCTCSNNNCETGKVDYQQPISLWTHKIEPGRKSILDLSNIVNPADIDNFELECPQCRKQMTTRNPTSNDVGNLTIVHIQQRSGAKNKQATMTLFPAKGGNAEIEPIMLINHFGSAVDGHWNSRMKVHGRRDNWIGYDPAEDGVDHMNERDSRLTDCVPSYVIYAKRGFTVPAAQGPIISKPTIKQNNEHAAKGTSLLEKAVGLSDPTKFIVCDFSSQALREQISQTANDLTSIQLKRFSDLRMMKSSTVSVMSQTDHATTNNLPSMNKRGGLRPGTARSTGPALVPADDDGIISSSVHAVQCSGNTVLQGNGKSSWSRQQQQTTKRSESTIRKLLAPGRGSSKESKKEKEKRTVTNKNVSRDVSEQKFNQEELTKLRKEFETLRKKIEKFEHLESSDVSSREREQQEKRDKKKKKEDGANVTQQRNPSSGNRSTSNRKKKKEKSGNQRPRSFSSDASSRDERQQEKRDKKKKKKKKDGATVTQQQKNRRPRSAHSEEQFEETKKTSKRDQNTRTNMQSHRVSC